MEDRDRELLKQIGKRGYYYTVTDEQIREHQKRTPVEILDWIESTNEFLYKHQTPEAREAWMKIRKGEFE